MGIKERHERQKAATTRGILDAARELFVADGYQHVSIRKIAERVEYSPAAIYSYFQCKDDIFLALAEEGFRMLFSAGAAESDRLGRIDAIRSGFWRVYEFSKEHPEYFALMFLDRSVPHITQDWQRFGFVRDMKQRIASLIQEAIDDGEFPAGTHPDTVLGVLTAAVHGVAAMRLCDRLVPGEDADALARDTLEAALTGLRAGFPRTFVPGTD